MSLVYNTLVNYKQKNPADNIEIEEAIKFLVFSVEKSGNNPKPVITHSLRMAFYLDRLCFPKNLVIAAILHDLLEDTEIKIAEIESKFGKETGKLVTTCTFDKSIEDRTLRYQTNYGLALKSGKDALFLRAADLLDNSNYYHMVNDKTVYEGLLKKFDHFLKVSKKIIGKNKVYKDLIARNKILHA